MFKTFHYYWNAARGYRFNPWRSPYIRWRFEIFLGKEASNLTASKFFHLAWKYRDNMERFVDWAAERAFTVSINLASEPRIAPSSGIMLSEKEDPWKS